MFGEQQMNALADYIRAALMLKYNEPHGGLSDGAAWGSVGIRGPGTDSIQSVERTCSLRGPVCVMMKSTAQSS